MKTHTIIITIVLILAIIMAVRNPVLTANVIFKTGELDYKCADCNIILISIDTLRADYLGAYGYSKNTTPNIDKFAEDAVLFENAYSQAPSTRLALRAIMTGKLVSNVNKKSINSYYANSIFLAEVLKEKGYTTVGFSDHMALGGNSEESGFSQYNMNILMRGFDSFQNYGKGREYVISHILTAKVTNWLEQGHENKFFLWVHYFDPHFNYNPLQEYESLFGYKKEECGKIYNGIDITKIREIQKDLTEKEIECLISLYQAEIFYTDKYVGEILDKIKELNLERNTVIIITSDHGEEFRERTMIGHGKTVYNEVIHVPLIIKMPNKKVSRVKENIGTKEIFNILTNLNSDKTIKFDIEVISRTDPNRNRTKKSAFTIISGNYKYIYNPETEMEEFYYLQEDVEEKNNLINSPLYEDKNQELKEKLMLWIKKNNVKTQELSKEALESEEETNKILRSLGYMV